MRQNAIEMILNDKPTGKLAHMLLSSK